MKSGLGILYIAIGKTLFSYFIVLKKLNHNNTEKPNEFSKVSPLVEITSLCLCFVESIRSRIKLLRPFGCDGLSDATAFW